MYQERSRVIVIFFSTALIHTANRTGVTHHAKEYMTNFPNNCEAFFQSEASFLYQG